MFNVRFGVTNASHDDERTNNKEVHVAMGDVAHVTTYRCHLLFGSE